MIITTNLVESSVGLNPIFAGCCGLVEIKVKLSVGEPNRTINRVHINNTGGCTTTVLEVNGITWTDPLTFSQSLTQLNEITCLLNVCSDCGSFPGLLTSFDFEVHWTNPGGGNQVWTFDMESIEASTTNPVNTQGVINWNACIDDCNSLQGEFFIINNPTPFTIPVGFSTTYLFTGLLNWFIDGVASGVGNSVSLPIPPGEHNVAIQTCPLPNNNDETIYFEITNCGSTYPIYVNFQPVYCGTCGISCRNVFINGENNWINGANYCSNNAGMDRFSIGAIINLQWNMTYNRLQAGQKFYFNPVLFDVNCNIASRYASGIIDSPPQSGWFFDLNDNSMIGNIFNMTMIGTGVNANSQRNINATIFFQDNTNFFITLNFYMISDLEDWISNVMLANQPKLLNSHVSAPTPLTNIVQSVYNSQKQLCLFTYMTDSNRQTLVNGNLVDFGCFLTKSIPWTARFWNQGLNATPSEFTNPQFKFKRNGVFVPNFSTVQQTELIFQFASLYAPIHDVVLWLFDTSQTDNFDNFVSNYDSSRLLIFDAVGSYQLQNHFYAPASAVTNLGGTLYEAKVTVDTTINPNGQWRVGAIVYGFGGFAIISNSFISDVIPVTQIPGIELCCSMNYSNTWNDYSFGLINECFAPTMKERIQNKMTITGGAFDDCLIDLGMNPSNSWIDYLQRVTLNIYRKVDNYPSPGQTTFFYFDSIQSNRIAGFPGNWQNNSNLIVTDDGSTLSTEWNGRVRYEATTFVSNGNVFVANTAQGFTRSPAGALASTYISVNNANFDWSDLDIYFEYQFEFDLSPIYGQSCEFVIVRNNLIHPVDFETNPQPYTQMLKSIIVKGVKNGVASTIVGPFCDGQFDYLLVEVQQLVSLDYTFIAMLDRFPYGVGNLLEANGGVSATGLTQLTVPEMYDVDADFSGGSAFFKIDLSLLSPGKYQICGVQLKKV